MSLDLTVSDNPQLHRFEATADGGAVAGFIEYQEARGLLVLTHTEVDRSFEGQGVGSTLARAALDDVRERELKALVVCPFILQWIQRHPEYADIQHNARPSAR